MRKIEKTTNQDVETGRLIEISEAMRIWFEEQNYAGLDPYLLDEKISAYRRLPFIGNAVGFLRGVLKPFHALIPERLFQVNSRRVFSNALGLILSGYCNLFKVTSDPIWLQAADHVYQLIRQNRSPGFNYPCWGDPFEWGSEIIYPANYPSVVVTSLVAHGLADHFSINQDKQVLLLMKDVIQHFLEENGFDDFGTSMCLYYTPNNPDLTYNTNVIAASFVVRLAKITGDVSLEKIGRKLTMFQVEGQNTDGSWFYTDKRGKTKLDTTIDHRHTCFVLEHLNNANRTLQSEEISDSVRKGWAYYEKNLLEGAVPRWSPTQTYPVDILDVGEAIIMSSELGELEKAAGILHFALNSLFDGKDRFYYKLFANGDVNKTVFIRWGQAWVFKGISRFLLESASVTGKSG